MASIPTIKSTTAEGAVMELLTYLQILEGATATNSNGRNYIQGKIDTDTKIFSGSFSLPVEQMIDSTDGSVKYTAVEYLTNPST